MQNLAYWCIVALFSVSVLGCSGSQGALAPAPVIATVAPNTGPTSGGTAVTVFGAHFQTGAKVQFASGQSSAVTFNDATNLSAVTPTGPAGAVDVKVTNPDGQSATLGEGFTYVAPVACAVPTTITSDTTLDPSCVWTVTDTTVVGGPSSPVLTILPGTTVVFASNPDGLPSTALQVGIDEPGALVANGTSSAGIIFTSASASPSAGDWGGIVIGPQSGGTSIQNATIAYAGGMGANDIADSAALTLEGGDLVGGSQSPSPVLADLTINNSAGHGIVFAGLTTGFGQSSGNIRINAWESASHFPIVIEANQGGTIPVTISATPATSPTAVVAFNSYVDFACSVVTNTTWPAIPLPYLALVTINVAPLSQSGPPATLTIAAPNTIEFSSGAELDIDPNSLGSGFLQANGTASNLIAFTSNQANPTTGAWGGINFWCLGNDQFQNSSLTYASIDWATSSNEADNESGEIAVLNGSVSPDGLQGPTISNCTFGHYADYGIAMVDIEDTTFASYVSNNVFPAAAKKVVLYCTGLITDGTCNSSP
jgi:hypothetical protein